MSTLDGGGVEATTSTDALDGGRVSQTGPLGATANPYGVTVQQVRELATHIGFDPSLEDPDFGPTRKQITDQMIEHWISLVTDSVQARLTMLARFQHQTERWVVLTGSARAAVTNGAASYLVSAAFPAKAGTNDQTSYSSELWSRYQDELGTLLDLGVQFDKDDAAGNGPTGVSGIPPRASYTRPRVPRGNGFFPTESPLGAPYLDQNRMNPRTGGYPAPGAEDSHYPSTERY